MGRLYPLGTRSPVEPRHAWLRSNRRQHRPDAPGRFVALPRQPPVGWLYPVIASPLEDPLAGPPKASPFWAVINLGTVCPEQR